MTKCVLHEIKKNYIFYSFLKLILPETKWDRNLSLGINSFLYEPNRWAWLRKIMRRSGF